MALPKYQQRQKVMRRRLREDEKFKQQSAQISIEVLSVVPVYILLESGYDKQKLTEFLLRYSKIVDDLANKRINTQRLAEQIESETGLKYQPGSWWNIEL